MKKGVLFTAVLCTLSLLTGCGDNKKSVSINYSGNEKTAEFAIGEIKTALENNGLKYKESGGTYTLEFKDYDAAMGEEEYSLIKNGKTFEITAGGANGLMYGGLEFAELLNVNSDIDKIEDVSEKPYIRDRGIRIRFATDLRTPSYTNQADCIRNGVEDVWNLDYWKDLFDNLARMRVNRIAFSEMNTLASMVKVPGYEDCALEDVWVYDGEYDDTYLGNGTNMYRDEHLSNYHVLKKMTIEEKQDYWYSVFQSAVDHGLKVDFSCMNIYTFAENGKYGITDDRDNETTKDYFYKALKQLLTIYPQISSLTGSEGENMDYPADTLQLSDQWISDTYIKAVREICESDPERTKTFSYGCQALANGQLSDYFLNELSTLPCEVFASKRYNDTHLYSVTDVTDNNEYLSRLPSNVKMKYMLKADDCIHFTWGNVDFARELMRNIINDPLEKEKVIGYTWGTDAYNISGKEYEFNDEEMNGKNYLSRHWMTLTMITRFAYNPDSMMGDTWDNLFASHYSSDASVAKRVFSVMNTASMLFPNVLTLFQPTGTDAAFLAELCWSNPTLFGFLGIKRFVNANNADPDGNTLSIAEYAQAIKAGTTTFTKETPLDKIANLKKIAEDVHTEIQSLKTSINESDDKALYNVVLDQEMLGYLSGFYSYHISSALNLRLYNDSLDESKKTLATDDTNKAIEYFTSFATLYKSRFKVERLARHGLIDPMEMLSDLKKDLSTISKWKVIKY